MPLSWGERIYEFFCGECENNGLRLRCLCADRTTATDSSDAAREKTIECEFYENMLRKSKSNDRHEIAIGIQGLKQMESANPNNPLLRPLPTSVRMRTVSFVSANLSRFNLSRATTANTNNEINTMSSSYATSISSRAPSPPNVPHRAFNGGGLASIQEVAHPVGRKGPARPAIDYIQLMHGDNRTVNGKCARWTTYEGTAWEGYYKAGPDSELFQSSDNLLNAPGYKPQVVEDLYPIVKEACVGEHDFVYRADSTKDERLTHALKCMGDKPDLICDLLGPKQAITGYEGITYHDVMHHKHEEDFPNGTVQEPVAEQIGESSRPRIVRGFMPETSQQKAKRLDNVVRATPWNAHEKLTSKVDLIYEHYTKPQKTRFINPTKLDVLDLYDEFDYEDLQTEQTSRMCIPGWTNAIKARGTEVQKVETTKARVIEAQQGKPKASMPAHPIMRLLSLPAEAHIKVRTITVHEFYKPATEVGVIKAGLKQSLAATKLKDAQPLTNPATNTQSTITAAPAEVVAVGLPSAKPSAELYAKSLAKVPPVFASCPPPKSLMTGAFHVSHLPNAAATAKILRPTVTSVAQDLPPPNPARPLRLVLTQPNLDPKRRRSSNVPVTKSVAKPATKSLTNATSKIAPNPTNTRRKSGGVQFAVDLPPKERKAQAAKQNQEEHECQMRAAKDIREREIQRAAKKRMKEFRAAEAKALKLKRAQGGMALPSAMTMGVPSGMAMVTAPKSGSTTPRANSPHSGDTTPRASLLNLRLVSGDLPEHAIESDDEDIVAGNTLGGMKVEMSGALGMPDST